MSTVKAATYLVIETFTSIQGEGVRIGRPSTFVRLAHCNLTCAWCDTTYAWKKGEMATPEKLAPEAIAARVAAPDVVLTGGEPLLHDVGPLLALLEGHFVTVETNATFYKPDARVGLFSLSPKLGSSGQTPDPAIIARYLVECPERVQLKFVVGDAGDLREIETLLTQLPDAAKHVPVILQPVGHPGDTRDAYCEGMRDFLEQTLLSAPFWREYQWRYLPQFHKLLWQDRRGI